MRCAVGLGIANLFKDAVDIAHTSRVVLNPGIQRLQSPLGVAWSVACVFLSHRRCKLCGGLVEAAAQGLAREGLPTVVTGQLADEAEQLINLEAVVGCEVNRCQLNRLEAVIACRANNIQEGVTLESANPDDDEFFGKTPSLASIALGTNPCARAIRGAASRPYPARRARGQR